MLMLSGSLSLSLSFECIYMLDKIKCQTLTLTPLNNYIEHEINQSNCWIQSSYKVDQKHLYIWSTSKYLLFQYSNWLSLYIMENIKWCKCMSLIFGVNWTFYIYSCQFFSSYMLMIFTVPISVYILSLPLPYLPEGTNLSPFFLLGCAILVCGLYLYNTTRPARSSSEVDWNGLICVAKADEKIPSWLAIG